MAWGGKNQFKQVNRYNTAHYTIFVLYIWMRNDCVTCNNLVGRDDDLSSDTTITKCERVSDVN